MQWLGLGSTQARIMVPKSASNFPAGMADTCSKLQQHIALIGISTVAVGAGPSVQGLGLFGAQTNLAIEITREMPGHTA